MGIRGANDALFFIDRRRENPVGQIRGKDKRGVRPTVRGSLSHREFVR